MEQQNCSKLRKDCIKFSHLFNLCTKYIMRNAGLKENEMEIGNKIAGRIINNLKCADNIILIVGIEESLIISC